ncbi:molybdopterin-synthase adenylyltransferase MoeB [Pelistega sp. NLN82]|uniref:Molybdopterin-synthase adenylyltransferase MoeB n=1 Tax=Pelistega ratti TaxID=2652177 RepID=A0A6L9Y875_9BURK|nr:molybdopterin-synthase adenylyltransferase MoeB [Pelistega ratti]NEN76028.1 molybdopterin-synthase adenylyltransferase MoeB [Pelistega ratti]
MNDSQLLRYARHIMLDEFGFEGQEKLASSKVLIVGMGGLGSPAAMYLAAAGVGTLILADDDKVELSNLQRQIIHQTNSLGLMKVNSASHQLNALNPDIQIQTIAERMTEERAQVLLQTVDMVLDCSDNYDTRQVLNRLCFNAHIPLIAAAAIRWEGMVTSFDFRQQSSPCYACLFDPDDNLNPDNCATLGVVSPLLGVMGSMQALEAIKLLIGAGESLVGQLAMFKAKTSQWQYLKINKSPHCKVCSKSS